MLIKNDDLISLFNYLDKYKIDKKTIINKMYKSLSINPRIIIDNLDIIKRYLDINEFINKGDYSLLKVTNLEYKLHYILGRYNTMDSKEIYNLLLKEVYESKDNICGVI